MSAIVFGGVIGVIPICTACPVMEAFFAIVVYISATSSTSAFTILSVLWVAAVRRAEITYKTFQGRLVENGLLLFNWKALALGRNEQNDDKTKQRSNEPTHSVIKRPGSTALTRALEPCV